MTQITVRVTENVQVGLEKIGRALENISDEELEAGLEEATEEARGGWPEGGIRGYNVPLTENGERNYQRTGMLGRETTWVREGRSLRIVSNAYSRKGQAYSVGVIGDANGAGQWAVHAGRWPRMADVARKWAKTITEKIQKRVNTEVPSQI